jgi:hypothetical protein
MVAHMRSFPIRMLAAAIALVFVLAAAADAKPRKDRQPPGVRTVVTVYPHHRGANLFPAGAVYYGTEYLGEDPDPFIRQQLLRDLTAHFGGAF